MLLPWTWRAPAAGLAIGCAVSSAACGEGEEGVEAAGAARHELSEFLVSTADRDCDWVSHRGRAIWGKSYDLPVGPRGSATPPAAWGICGITRVSGQSHPGAVLRILVGAHGRYRLLVGVAEPGRQQLAARVGCVKLSEFSGLPAFSSARATRDYAVHDRAAPEPAETLSFRKVYTNGGQSSDLCLWTGFEGSVSSVPLDDLDSHLFAGSRYDLWRGWSVDAITFGPAPSDFTTHGRCDGFAAAHAWTYHDALQSWRSTDAGGVFTQYRYAEATTLAVTPATHFCWLTGISTYGPTLYADLHAATDPASGATRWRYQGRIASTMAGVQCVAYQGERSSPRRFRSAGRSTTAHSAAVY